MQVGCQLIPDQDRPDQLRPDQLRPDQDSPLQLRPDQESPDQLNPDQERHRPGQAGPAQPRPGQPHSRLNRAQDSPDHESPLRFPSRTALRRPLAKAWAFHLRPVKSYSPVSSWSPFRTTALPRPASSVPVPVPRGHRLSGPRGGRLTRRAPGRSVRCPARFRPRGQPLGSGRQQRLDLVRREPRALLEQQRRGAGDDGRGLRRTAAAEEPRRHAARSGSSVSR